MTYEYTTITENGFTRICATDDDIGYAEVQQGEAKTEDEIQSLLNEFFEDAKSEKIYHENLEPDFTQNFRDDVYMAGEVKRVDYSCDRSEALTQINRLVTAFPEYTVEGLTANSQNVIGEYGNYRPPYPDNCISFYDFSTPSIETLAAYGCTTDTYGDDLLQWHGIKHDLTAGTKQAKFVFSQNHGTYLSNPPVQLPPNRTAFYARIHNADGSVSQWVDTYVISTINYMRDWCADVGKPFPLPDSVTDQPWCFGIVHDDTNGAIECVKAYVRHRY